MYDAQNEFKEIVFPSIKVKKLPYGLYGNYNKVKNHINISSLMARRDLKYIKVVLYHELSHYFIMNHSEDFIRIFKSKFKEGPSLDIEFKGIKYRDCL
jgi:predicted metal-dependent hydrolase